MSTNCVVRCTNFWPRHHHLTEVVVIFADDQLLVLNKPAGLLSVPGRGADKQDCLSRRVQQLYPDALVVHRLDMATSGLMVMARGLQAQRMLNKAFASHSVHKRYEAVVDGVLASSGTNWQQIDLPIFLDWDNRPKRVVDQARGKPSSTRWQVLHVNPDEQTTRLSLKPITGRSHQLRVHLQAIGHAILGDMLYGTPEVAAKTRRLLLHACELEITHPVNQQTLRFVSPAPF
ncbi:MAG: RluA family pseudouridine synthase [Betaproteobacteria bacterium]|nr:RluA family pseudouridine synthase [Betaproteobacteria bacterium]NCP82385.1 RluA family pseudouridine synthase [Rhodoferax sp.]NCS60164.1 RluA family pseudouridine synthase [Rhodoferax sp.]PIZ21694.1 MAG: RNA pseudouridine synthase [Comamonadaceae bacterium CG_4_10_14_0_8_um_filter_57_29]PJC15248.1 MAG: RNA pseudouridine synthase [Comamonadaceae bacterium CG_4_9_14_0_8_um_filter_57_21]